MREPGLALPMPLSERVRLRRRPTSLLPLCARGLSRKSGPAGAPTRLPAWMSWETCATSPWAPRPGSATSPTRSPGGA
jgi:hypothetical protein